MTPTGTRKGLNERSEDMPPMGHASLMHVVCAAMAGWSDQQRGRGPFEQVARHQPVLVAAPNSHSGPEQPNPINSNPSNMVGRRMKVPVIRPIPPLKVAWLWSRRSRGSSRVAHP
jgi:hypothetical protein